MKICMILGTEAIHYELQIVQRAVWHDEPSARTLQSRGGENREGDLGGAGHMFNSLLCFFYKSKLITFIILMTKQPL